MMTPFSGKGEPLHWDMYRKTWANPKIWGGEILNPGRTPIAQPVAQQAQPYQAQPYQANAAIAPTDNKKTDVTRPRRKGTSSSGTILVDENNY
jgi:hypothetical protein